MNVPGLLRSLAAAFVKGWIADVEISTVQLILDVAKRFAEAYKMDMNFH